MYRSCGTSLLKARSVAISLPRYIFKLAVIYLIRLPYQVHWLTLIPFSSKEHILSDAAHTSYLGGIINAAEKKTEHICFLSY
jgi:hypothetical protein